MNYLVDLIVAAASKVAKRMPPSVNDFKQKNTGVARDKRAARKIKRK